MRNLSNFEREHIVGTRLAGAPVTNTATSLGVPRARVSKVMLTYTKRRKTSAKRNSGRKSTLIEKDRPSLRCIVSKNHRTIAA
jgi:hypothetical protein